MSDSAKSIASIIIEELKTRKSLMEDWDAIDLDIQEEILEKLANIIETNIIQPLGS